MAKMTELSGMVLAFAKTCTDRNTTAELKALQSSLVSATDCYEWGITHSEWLDAISAALEYLERKPHGNTGKRNAAKYRPDERNAHVHIRCSQIDKTKWLSQAEAEGKKLTVWAIDKLNK
jgi:hypothetical protein